MAQNLIWIFSIFCPWPCLSTVLFIFLFIYRFVYLRLCLPSCLSTVLFIFLFIYRFVYHLVYLPLCLFLVYLPLCLFSCLCTSLFTFLFSLNVLLCYSCSSPLYLYLMNNKVWSTHILFLNVSFNKFWNNKCNFHCQHNIANSLISTYNCIFIN